MIWLVYGWLCMITFATAYRMVQLTNIDEPFEVIVCVIGGLLHSLVIIYAGYWIYTHR